MTMFVLLLSCSSPPTKPEGDGTGDTVDSVIDSAESAESDTDLPDTSDSEDTASPVKWTQGDNVPGWDDADCSEGHPAMAYVSTFPDVFAVQGTFLPDMAGTGPHLLSVRLRDCTDFACETDIFDQTVPYVLADLDATRGDDGHRMGTGEWGPDATANRQVQASGRSLLIDWADDGTLTSAAVTVCIQRLRPDEIQGVVRAEVTPANYPFGTVSSTRSLVFRFPFDVLLPDHAGFDSTQPDRPADQPLGYTTGHFTYDQPYDDAWPWEDITDPSIREQVYDRYTPYNAP